MTTAESDAKKICRYFLEGKCARGKKCRFTHPEPEVKTPTPAPTPVKVELKKTPVKATTPKVTPNKKPATPNTANQHRDRKRKGPEPVEDESSESSANEDSSDSDSSDSDSDSDDDSTPMEVTVAVVAANVVLPAATQVKSTAAPAQAKPAPVVVALPVAQPVVSKSIPASILGDPKKAAKRRKVDSENNTNDGSGINHFDIVKELMSKCENHPSFREAYKNVYNKTADPAWKKTSNLASVGGSNGVCVYGLDCEMVEAKDNRNALGRATLVYLGPCVASARRAPMHVVFDRFVTEKGRVVVDYRTSISGLTQEQFDAPDCLQSIEEVQQMLIDAIPANAILVGHGLNNDLEALRLVHKRVVDTAYVFTSKMKSQLIGLKDTVGQVLGQEIHPANTPHNSAEDACWALELVRKVVDQTDQFRTLPHKQRMAKLDESLTMELPEHFLRRLQVFQLPEGATLENVAEALALTANHKRIARDIVFKTKVDNNKAQKPLGSTMITMDFLADATTVFQGLSNDQMKSDANGMHQKKVYLNKTKYPNFRHFWVKSLLEPGTQAIPTPTPVAVLAPTPAAVVVQPGVANTPAFCPFCGTPRQSNAKFCGGCGAKLA